MRRSLCERMLIVNTFTSIKLTRRRARVYKQRFHRRRSLLCFQAFVVLPSVLRVRSEVSLQVQLISSAIGVHDVALDHRSVVTRAFVHFYSSVHGEETLQVSHDLRRFSHRRWPLFRRAHRRVGAEREHRIRIRRLRLCHVLDETSSTFIARSNQDSYTYALVRCSISSELHSGCLHFLQDLPTTS